MYKEFIKQCFEYKEKDMLYEVKAIITLPSTLLLILIATTKGILGNK